MAKVIDGSEFTVDDPRLKALLVENQRKEDEKALAQQGLDLSTYLRLVNMDKKTYENNVYANLSARLKAQAVEAAIFKAAKLPEPTAAELAEVAKKGGIADFKAFQADLAKQYLAHNKKAAKGEAELFVAQQVAPIREQAVLDKVVGFVLANND